MCSKFSGCYLAPLVLLVAFPEVVADFVHEFGHARVAVVACHVRMHVLPDPLDLVVVRALRRQEVQLHLPAQVAAQRRQHRRTPWWRRLRCWLRRMVVGEYNYTEGR
jgi:hypothetical protein